MIFQKRDSELVNRSQKPTIPSEVTYNSQIVGRENPGYNAQNEDS